MTRLIFLFLILIAHGFAQWPFGGTDAKRIQGKPVVSPLTCSDGQQLTWVSANSRFECGSAGGAGSGYATIADEGSDLTQQTKLNFIGSGINCVNNGGSSRTDCTITGGGASAVSDLTDCKLTYSSSTVINVGACAAGVGNYNNTAVAACSTSAAPSSSGTLRAYIAQDGTYTLGYSGANTAACTGWTTATSISAFPYGSFPISTITWTSGSWNNDAVDERRLVRSNPIAAGADMDSSVVNGVNTLNPASATIPRKANIQSGALLRCASASGSSPYTCAMSPTLTGYTDGMIVEFEATGTALSGTVNLNIDSIGNAAIKQCDGSTNPASGDIAVGRQVRLTYDGTVFRLPCNPATVTSGGATITSTAYASLPGTCTEGNLYLLTDSMIEMARCGASNTYTYYRNGKQITLPPSVAGLTTITAGSSGTCSVTNSGGAIVGKCNDSGSQSGGNISNRYVGSLPAGDTWTITIGYTQQCYSDYCGIYYGVADSNTSTGAQKVVSSTPNSTGSRGTQPWYSIANWTNWAYASAVFSRDGSAFGDTWARITQTSGGNRSYQVSSDGINWQTLTTESAGTTFDYYMVAFSGGGTGTIFSLKIE